jgi:rhodanese-related sulfurtransferase
MIEEIEPSDLNDQQRTAELWLILDVREPWEVEAASIAGTCNIPMAAIPDRIRELDPTRPIAVLCHSGGRSRRVAEHLASCGFRRVANVIGGIDRWAQTVDPEIPRY